MALKFKKKCYSEEEYNELLAAYQELLEMYNRLVIKRVNELVMIKSTSQSLNRSFAEINSVVHEDMLKDYNISRLTNNINNGIPDEVTTDTLQLVMKMALFKGLLETQESFITKLINSDINKVNDEKVDE
jgi:hypothetical protein